MRKLRAKEFAFQWFIRPTDLPRSVWTISDKCSISHQRSISKKGAHFYSILWNIHSQSFIFVVWSEFSLQDLYFSLFLAYRISNSHGFSRRMTAHSDRGEHWRIRCKNRDRLYFKTYHTINKNYFAKYITWNIL